MWATRPSQTVYAQNHTSNYGRLLFVITNLKNLRKKTTFASQAAPRPSFYLGIFRSLTKNLKKKSPAGPLSAACSRTRLWTVGADGSREKRQESEKVAPGPEGYQHTLMTTGLFP